MSEIKVSDRRMFTPEGELREEFQRELEEAARHPEPEPEPQPEVEPEPAPAAAEPPASAPPAAGGGLADVALPAKPPPGLLELLQIFGEFALVSMGEVPLPDGRLARDLDAARFYIDLLSAFHAQWRGALKPQDARSIESFLDQLRLRFVSHRG